jgi:hypothetical protein
VFPNHFCNIYVPISDNGKRRPQNLNLDVLRKLAAGDRVCYTTCDGLLMEGWIKTVDKFNRVVCVESENKDLVISSAALVIPGMYL